MTRQTINGPHLETQPNLAWVDLETTGLDEFKCLPLEIGVVITDADLNVLREWSYVLHQDLYLNDLSDWVIDTHSANGLLKEVKNSRFEVELVDQEISNLFLASTVFYVGDEKPPLCGNTISFDRAWLKRWFPLTHDCFHYRSIDVSSIKELQKRWMPGEAVSNKDTSLHRSIPDIYDSIAELKHYYNTLWMPALTVESFAYFGDLLR